MTDPDPSNPSEPDHAAPVGVAAASRPAGLADGKGPDALRPIGEVSAALGLRQHVLRYWEEQFPLLRPLKRSGGRRYYRPGDIALVERIDQLVHREGYTLRGARLVIEGKAVAPARAPSAPANAAPPEPVASVAQSAGSDGSAAMTGRLRTLRDRLATALAAN